MSFPITLEERLRARKIIPFVGAGVSKEIVDQETNKHLFPGWKELLTQSAERLDQEKKGPYANIVRSCLELDPPDYLEAARRAREGLGSVWFDFLNDQLNPKRERVKEESLKLAQSVWGLGSRLIITTNYDRVLQWAYLQQGNFDIWDIEAQAEQAALLRDGPRHSTIWHLHGHIGNAAKLILTPDGYSRLYPVAGEAENQYRAALETLRYLMASYSFLFIGFSLDDARFGLQLKGIHEIFSGGIGPHYVLAHRQERERISALGLPVEIITYSDFGEPLITLLEDLGRIAAEKETPTSNKVEDELPTPAIASYDPRKPVFYVPYRAKGNQVIGREDALQAVRQQLTQGHRTNIGQTASFLGLGGLGKTQLAVEYAYRYRDEYPNGVIWLTADQDIDAQLTDLAERAQWAAPQSEHKYKLEIARQRLRTVSDCLIIFDNLEKIEAIQDYLPEPQVEPHILVTSRTEQPGFTPVPIDPLDKDLSLKLLLQEAGKEPTAIEDWKAAGYISEALGGLPLALELAGAYLRHRPVSWQQYRDLLSQNLKAALPGKFLSGSFTQHEKDIYSTLKVNEVVFTEEPRLREILDLLTWSGSSPMGLSLMCALLDIQNSIELTNSIGLGTALRLLQKSPDSESYAIHRLVAEVRREDIPLREREDYVKQICERVGDWFQGKRDDFANLHQFEAEIDHLRAWQTHAAVYSPEHACRLTWLQAYPPYHRGRYQEAKHWVERALNFFDDEHGNNLGLKAHLLSDIGYTYSGLGDHKRGLEYKEKALAIRLELFGERHSDTATSLDNIGTEYSDLGDHKRALEYEEKALAIRIELLDERHPDIARSLNNIGAEYSYLGDHKRALEYGEKALAIRLELFGERHPNTAESFSNIGAEYSYLGDHKRALEYGEKALAIQLELFGERHPDTAQSFNNFGVTYGRMGDGKQSKEYIEKGLNIRKELFSDLHPETVSSAMSLASLLNNLGERSRALQILDEFLHKLPKDHPRYSQLKQQRTALLAQSIRPGFRQPSSNPAKKKGKKKR
jgi:tetratricopeptide (TPR) repeat protein